MRKLITILFITLLGNVVVDGIQKPIHDGIPKEYFAQTVEAKKLPKTQLKKIDVKIADVPEKFKKPAQTTAKAPQGDVESIVRQAAIKYGLNPDHFVSVARCESGLNPSAQNTGYYAGGGHPTGVFQFLPETWTRISGRAGISGSVTDPVANANVAAWAWANGYSGEWECQG